MARAQPTAQPRHGIASVVREEPIGWPHSGGRGPVSGPDVVEPVPLPARPAHDHQPLTEVRVGLQIIVIPCPEGGPPVLAVDAMVGRDPIPALAEVVPGGGVVLAGAYLVDN